MKFLDSLTSSTFPPFIHTMFLYTSNQQGQLSTHKLVVIKFFLKFYQPIISCNLTAVISDHLPQFLITPEIFRNSSIRVIFIKRTSYYIISQLTGKIP